MPSEDDRVVRNEGLVREVNVHIANLEETMGSLDELLPLLCECAKRGCMVPLKVDRRTFDAVRENPLRFIVVPGHERPEIETVIERRPGYLIVEQHSS